MNQSIEEKAGFFESAPGTIVISEADFQKALHDSVKAIHNKGDSGAISPAYAADYGTKMRATNYAGAANNPATLGIIANLKKSEKGLPFRGNIFFVVDNADVNLSGKKLEATKYRIAAIELAGTASFIGTDTHFAQVDSMLSGMGRRCCGTPNICIPTSPVTGDSHLQGPLPFEPTNTRYSLWGVRGAAGNPTIHLDFFATASNIPGLDPQSFECIQTHDLGCDNITPICDFGMPGFLFNDNDMPDIPSGSNACGEHTKPGDFKNPPKWCTYAYLLDECKGKIPEDYFRPYAERQSGNPPLYPPLCTVARSINPEGICGESYKQKLFIKQIELRKEAGWMPGRPSKQCTPAQMGGSFSGGKGAGMQHCVVCDSEGNCNETVEKSPWNPIADRSEEELEDNSQIQKDPKRVHHFDETEMTGKVNKPKDPAPKKTPDPVIPPPPPPASPPPPRERLLQPGGRAEDLTKSQLKSSSQPSASPSSPSKPAVAQQDPIRLSDGSFLITHTDLSFKGPSRDLEFIRTYQSNWAKRSTLGTNWTHNWDVWVQPLNADNMPDWLSPWCAGGGGNITAVFLHDAGVTELYLLDIGTQLYLPQAGAFGTLTRTIDKGWALRDPDGRIRIFDEDGDLVSDRDRFGNGFTVDSEPTPLFTLYKALRSLAASGAAFESKYSRRQYILAYLIGESPRPSWNFAVWPELELEIKDFEDLIISHDQIDLIYARDYLLYLIEIAKTNHQMIDRIDGFRKKRPVSVKDDTGRELLFNYYRAPLIIPYSKVLSINKQNFNFQNSDWAELLKNVTGPADTFISFEYSRPVNHPVELNEEFLSRTNRNDISSNTTGIPRSMDRWYEFKYESCSDTQLSKFRDKVENSFIEYFGTFMGCSYNDIYNNCKDPVLGDLKISGGNAFFYAHLQANAFVSEVTGRISTVINTGEIESETRFNSDPWNFNFGKAIAQRWGAFANQVDMDLDNSDDNWQTNLPKTTFQYQDAGPSGKGNDLTDSFLPQELLVRYPLEVYTGEAAEEFPETVVASKQDGSCDYDMMEKLRKKLPGYRLQLEYYELAVNEQHPKVDLPLKRSRLLPKQLVMAQVGDPTHNDLISGITEDISVKGGFKLDRITGRRKIMASNGNRLCSWIRNRDRDGAVHYFGLNYRGQALVDAILEDGKFIITERLVNADGLVVQERKPVLAETHWNTKRGYKYFGYDEIDPKENKGWNEWLPVFWSRRANLLRIEDYAEGGFVMNDNENGKTEKHLGRYIALNYEPLFNQIKSQLAGTIHQGSKKFVAHSYTSLIYDYQELSLEVAADDSASIVPFLESLVAWGFEWLRTKTGEIDPAIVGTWQLPLKLYSMDLNNDGITGNRFAVKGENRAVGLPVVVVSGSMNSQLQRTTKISWAPNGRPAYILGPDGELEQFEYYSINNQPNNIYGNAKPPQDTDVNSGYRGFLGRRKKLRNGILYDNSYGPQEFPSQILTGPYKWIKAKGNDPITILQALGLPAEIANDLIDSLGTTSGNFIKMVYSYDVTGRINKTFSPIGHNLITRDTDGRIVEFIDVIKNKTVIEYGYLGLPVKIAKFDTSSNPIGLTELMYDAEGRTIFKCEALEKTGGQHGDPAKSVKRIFMYSPEGNLIQQIEPEGLVITYEYNARKLMKNVIYEDTQTNAWRGTVFIYDLDGRMTKTKYGVKNETDPAVLEEEISYDGLGRIQHIIDKRGTKWLQIWSYRDLLVGKKDQDNRLALSFTSKSLQYEQWKYNEFGEVINHIVNGIILENNKRTLGGRIYLTDGTGKGETWQTYDLLGRPAWLRDAAGTETIYTYNEKPNRVGIVRLCKDANGVQLSTTIWKDLNAFGKPKTESTFANGISIKQEFDNNAAGHLIAQRNHLMHEKRYYPNWLGWVLKFQEDRDMTGGVFDEAMYEHDHRGLVRHLIDPAGYQTTWEYNALGELISQNSEGVNVPVVSGFKYDRLGRIVQTKKGDVECKTLYDHRGDATIERYNNNNKWITFIEKEFDTIGRIKKSSHSNPALDWLNETDRKIVTERGYDELGHVVIENTLLDKLQQFSSHSKWNEFAGGWKRDVFHTARHWSSARSEIYDGAGRMVHMQRSSAQTATGNTYFNWVGDFYAGRVQHYQGHFSPFREEIQLDGFSAPEQTTYRAIDLDSALHPLNTVEGLLYCPGSWNAAACGKPLLEIGLKRDSLGRIASLGWQFFHPQIVGGILQSPNHPSNWRGYTYDSREHLSSNRELDGTTIVNTGGLQNYYVKEGDLQTIAPNPSKSTYQREAAVGGTTSIIDASNASTRFRLPTPRGKGHQLTQVEVNGNLINVNHNAQGQIDVKGQDQLIYHPHGQLAYVRRNNKLLEAYLYDAEGRLVGVVDEQNLTSSILFDGHPMIAAINNLGIALWEATWGPGMDKLLEWIEYPTGKVYAALTDSRNSIVGLWNVDENKMETIAEYTAEGLGRILSPVYETLCDESSSVRQSCLLRPSCNFVFGSLWKSSVSRLVWMRNRWYAPDLNQFISADPMGYVDGYNMFTYAVSDSINKKDPYGLKSTGFAVNDRIDKLKPEAFVYISYGTGPKGEFNAGKGRKVDVEVEGELVSVHGINKDGFFEGKIAAVGISLGVTGLKNLDEDIYGAVYSGVETINQSNNDGTVTTTKEKLALAEGGIGPVLAGSYQSKKAEENDWNYSESTGVYLGLKAGNVSAGIGFNFDTIKVAWELLGTGI